MVIRKSGKNPGTYRPTRGYSAAPASLNSSAGIVSDSRPCAQCPSPEAPQWHGAAVPERRDLRHRQDPRTLGDTRRKEFYGRIRSLPDLEDFLFCLRKKKSTLRMTRTITDRLPTCDYYYKLARRLPAPSPGPALLSAAAGASLYLEPVHP